MFRHFYLLNIKNYISIYMRGSYCWMEIDIKKTPSSLPYVVQFFCIDGKFVNHYQCPF